MGAGAGDDRPTAAGGLFAPLPAPAGGLLAAWRRICLALPEVTERPSHGTPTFFVAGKRAFVQCWPEGHHGERFAQVWCAAPLGVLAELLASEPDRFFRPPYVGGRGWIGVRMSAVAGEEEIARICEEAYSSVAPPRLQALLGPGAGARQG